VTTATELQSEAVGTLRGGPTTSAPAIPARDRAGGWWLGALEKRRARMHEEYLDEGAPTFSSSEERASAVAFFNAAFRAEESGLRQAHELAGEVSAWDPELADILRLYGDEEGWHRELLTEFLGKLGGAVRPMGRVTSTFYRLYAKAKRMETIVLTNLMFEVIGSTTYRLALGRVEASGVTQMLRILARDESFHVPLNVYFLRRVLERDPAAKRRLRPLFYLLFASLLLLPLASRPKARAFDKLGVRELARAYAEQLAYVFESEPRLGLRAPSPILWLLGSSRRHVRTHTRGIDGSQEAAERTANRGDVDIAAL